LIRHFPANNKEKLAQRAKAGENSPAMPLTRDVLIQTSQLTRRYSVGKSVVNALSEVELTVPHGEFTALVGPSGSGKSTLLNLIGGLDHPSSGEIHVNGLSLGAAAEPELVRYRRERVGFIFQSFNLLPTLTALENVEAPLMLAESPLRDRRERATALLESVGLGPRLQHKPNELSGGEKQRVAIARALANRPLLLLADEPTGNLDSKTGAAVLDLLCSLLKAQGLTMIMVTHDPEIAARADRIIHLRDGSIQAIETKRPGATNP
jgi:putative ABC transport system ATP-binding protein